MRRKTRNGKVLRAMAMGLATMIAVTATPVTALAAEGNDGSNGNDPSEEETTPTAESVSAGAVDRAEDAEKYTGTLKDETANTPASGTIGTEAQEALDDVAKAEARITAENELAKKATEVSNATDKLLADTNPGNDGLGQIKNAEG